MITHITRENAAEYSMLFEEASLKLGLLSGEQITSLNEYFAHLAEIVNSTSINLNDKYKFTKLPLDENYIVINANSRKINVPSIFSSNGIGVVGDHEAEVVYFQIDRFFDAIDLGSEDIRIYIQWEAPNGKKGFSINYGKFIENESVSDVERDQKIVFGWAINKDMTESDGRIRFAVHFIRKDANEELLYAFNTQPAELAVHNTLKFNEVESTDTILEQKEQEIRDLLRRISSNGIYDLSSDLPGIPEFVQDFIAYEVYAPTIATEGVVYFNDQSCEISTTEETGQHWGKYIKLDETDYIFKDGKFVNIPTGGFALLKVSAKTSLGSLYYTVLHDRVQINDSRYVYSKVDLDNEDSLAIDGTIKYYYIDNGDYKVFPYVGNFDVEDGQVVFNDVNYELYTRESNPNPASGAIKVVYESAQGKDYNSSQVYYNTSHERMTFDQLSVNENNKITAVAYEQVMIYTLIDKTNVIGQYGVKVESVMGLNTQEAEQDGDIKAVKVLGPQAPVLSTTDIDTDDNGYRNVILEFTEGENEDPDTYTGTLSVNYNADAFVEENAADISYIWTLGASTLSNTSSTLELSLPDDGADINNIYVCTAQASKHHATAQSENSISFRVTGPVVAPALTSSYSSSNGIIEVRIPGVGSTSDEFSNLVFTVAQLQSDSLQYALIKENIVSNEGEEVHVIKLSPEDFERLGITESDDIKIDPVGRSSNPFIITPTTDIISFPQSGLATVENNTITLTKEDLGNASGWYRLIVINTLNNNKKYTLSDPISVLKAE